MFGYGPEKIVFAGDHDNDPVVAATYEGDGKFSFEFNSFTSSCKAVVVEGDVTGDTAELNKVYKQICLGPRAFRKVEPIESSLRLPTGTETRSMSRIQPFWHHMRTSSKP